MSDTVPLVPATPRAMIAAVLLVVASALGGCAGGGATGSGSYAMASTGSGPTVAFESIDGPRRRCLTGWSACSTANRAAQPVIVSAKRGFYAAHYLSAQVVRGDHDRLGLGRLRQQSQRALRLSGEETPQAGRDAWRGRRPRLGRLRSRLTAVGYV